ncbi:HigA family addiction module antitoxin, partial [Thiolapillus sp.]|uniref:HigA family addiction module antitoxin n=1 Tax=Thiolapillus sp. TaxID=2017437 RepID=UPI003AF4C0D5
MSPNDWTPRLDAYFASPLALCARRVSSAASRLLGSTSLRFALHGWQRLNGNRAITADTALRLARYFGTSAEFWLNLQTDYDLRLARR